MSHRTTPADRIDRHDVLYEHAARMPSVERASRMVELYSQYARCWVDGDVDRMLDLLVDAPLFEQYPQRIRIAGRDAARARAERLLPLVAQLDPRATDQAHETGSIAFGEDVLAYEFSDVLALADGTRKRCHLAMVVTFSGDKIAGERVYTDRRLSGLVDEALGEDFFSLLGVTEVGIEGGRIPEDRQEIGSAPGAPAGDLLCPELFDAARRLPRRERAVRMIEVNLVYAQHYFDGDFERMFDCLIECPVFEHYPRAVRIEGRDAVRERSKRSYSTVIRQLDPRKGPDTHYIASSCVGEHVLIHEFSNLFVLPDGTSERCYTLAVVPFRGDSMVGERIYSDRHLSSMNERTFGVDFEARADVTLL